MWVQALVLSILSPHLNCLSCASKMLSQGWSWPFGTPTIGKPRLNPSTTTKFFLDFWICLAWSWKIISVVSHSFFPKGKGQLHPCLCCCQLNNFQGLEGKWLFVVGFFFWGGRCLIVRERRKKGIEQTTHKDDLQFFEQKKIFSDTCLTETFCLLSFERSWNTHTCVGSGWGCRGGFCERRPGAVLCWASQSHWFQLALPLPHSSHSWGHQQC